MHAAQDRPTELNPRPASQPGAERSASVSSKSAAETVADMQWGGALEPG